MSLPVTFPEDRGSRIILLIVPGGGEQSIREFCDLETPIIMFDKDLNFVVAKLTTVSDVVTVSGLRSADLRLAASPHVVWAG